jgi:hypothetical protein
MASAAFTSLMSVKIVNWKTKTSDPALGSL